MGVFYVKRKKYKKVVEQRDEAWERVEHLLRLNTALQAQLRDAKARVFELDGRLAELGEES